MKIEIKEINIALSEEQKTFVNEKMQKIKKLTDNFEDQSHIAHISFKHIESANKDENIVCKFNLILKWHKEIFIERSWKTVEKSFMETKTIAINEISKVLEKIHPNKIH